MTAAADPAQAYGWYGDDFTGATDTLATIAERGRRAFLFLSVPEARHLAAAGPLDAVGIAGEARAMGRREMADELAPAGRFLRDAGIRLLHYKCCSTFDSAAEAGNLATAIATLRPFAGDGPAVVVGGQPSLRRYCAFSNLFAAAGDGIHRLDRHPTMARHPATPMHEADLRRHLAAQGLDGVEAVHWPAIEAGGLDAAWRALGPGPGVVLLDALTDGHVAAIGALLRRESAGRPLLAVGASSVAEAFFGDGSGNVDASPADAAPGGPVLGFAGSLSPLTRAQIEAATSFRRIAVDPAALAEGEGSARLAAEAAALLRDGRNVLLFTTPAGAAHPAADRALAGRSAALVDAVLKAAPVKRLAVAGGDTSSRVARALGIWGLAHRARIAPGVSLCRTRSGDQARDDMLVMLKGGQMGDVGLFDRFAGLPA